MNLDHLTTFLTVAETGSLTAAAQALFITQPAVSHQIKALEKYLRVRLFVRQKKGMLLTVEGEDLRAACQNVMRAADDLSFQAQRINELKRSKVTISTTSFVSGALVPAVMAFKGKYPLVSVSLIFNNTAQVVECAKNNAVDIGFASSLENTHPSLTSATVHRERLLLLAKRGHPLCGQERVRPEDLRGHLFVAREVGTYTRKHTEEWFASCPMPENTVETTRAGSVRSLIFAGGVGVVAESSMRADIAEGKICVLPAENLKSWVDCSIYASTARPLSRAARAFLETIFREKCLSRTEALRAWLDSLP